MFRHRKFCSVILQQFAGQKRFAGHSKWANIKHDKAIKDQARASMFYKYSRMVRIAIQDGGSTNPTLNSYLRTVIDQATKQNMPMATINNQIKKFNVNEAQLKKCFIELKSQNRMFFVCEAYTENLSLFKQNMNTAMRKTGNTAFADVRHFFDEAGIIAVAKPDGKFTDAQEFEDKLTEDAIESDAQEVEDVDFENKSATFVCRPIDIEKVKRSLLNLGYVVDASQHIFIPLQTVTPTEAEMKAHEKLRMQLSKIEGFENLYSNVELPETWQC